MMLKRDSSLAEKYKRCLLWHRVKGASESVLIRFVIESLFQDHSGSIVTIRVPSCSFVSIRSRGTGIYGG